MSNIEKNLISNKSACYIFDIDGCMADVNHLVLTNEEAYEANMNKYNLAKEKYQSDYKAYEYELNQFNKGFIKNKPIEPIKPTVPQKYETAKKDKIDYKYFYDNLSEAIPIEGVIDLFIALALTKKVIILTGRSENSRSDTLDWLRKVITEKYNSDMFRRINFQMIFKPEKDNNPTEKFKREKVLELAKQYNIQLIIDDCPANIEEFTKLGFLVLSPNKEYREI